MNYSSPYKSCKSVASDCPQWKRLNIQRFSILKPLHHGDRQEHTTRPTGFPHPYRDLKREIEKHTVKIRMGKNGKIHCPSTKWLEVPNRALSAAPQAMDAAQHITAECISWVHKLIVNYMNTNPLTALALRFSLKFLAATAVSFKILK